MSVSNGQPVSAEVTNAAFMSRTTNTDTVGSVGLLKPSGSGALILDTQKTINNVIAATGMADQDSTGLSFANNNYVTDGSSAAEAISALDNALDTVDGYLASHISDTSTHGTAGDIVGTSDTQVLTNKDIDGGTASNTSRITLPKAAKATLDGLTRKEATLVYASDEDKVYYDDGSTLKAVGTGSGGGGVNFITNSDGEAGTTGWSTYNGVLTASAFASSDVANCGTAHNIPSGVYDIKVKILSVSTPCNLTVGAEYYAVYSSSTFVLFTTTIAGTPVDITADATITFSEIRPRVAFGTANVTWTTTSTNPLSGVSSFLLTKDAANRQYQGVMSDFSIDIARKSKMLKVSFDYIVNSGTFAAGSSTTDSDMIVYLYDVTNSRLIEPSTFKLYTSSSTLPDKYQGYFQTSPDSTSYRLIFHVATTSASAWALKVDNVAASPSEYAAGTIITDWVSFVPVYTALSTNPTLGSGATNLGYWRRVGDSMEIRTAYIQSNAGTAGSGDYYIGIPNGRSIDLTKATTVQAGQSVGTITIFNGTSVALGTIQVANSGAMGAYITPIAGTATNWTGGGTYPFSSAQLRVGIQASVPIQGWSAGAQMSDGYDGRSIIAKSIGAVGSTASGAVLVAGVSLDTTNSMSGGRFTVPSSGYYKIYGSLRQSSSVDFTAYIYVNGALTEELVGVKGTDQTSHSYTTARYATAGTILDIRVNNTVTLSHFSFSIEKLSGSAFMSPTATVAFFARDTAGDVIGTSLSLIKFTSIQNSTHGAYSTTTGLFTAESSGYYSASFMVATANVTLSTSQRFQAVLYKGASIYAYGSRENGVGVSQFYSSNGSVESVYLNAGETLSVYAISDVATTASTVDEASHFSVVKVK
jgi:hypothetical protein